MKALVLLAALATTAHADDHTDVVTTQPLALVARGVSVGYEHLMTQRLSVVALAGVRAAAEGDFSSSTLTAGGELRFWPRARPGYQLRGLYIALHASAGRTHLVDDVMDTSVGTSVELTERVDVGWRFVAWRRLGISPTLGLGGHQDIDTSGRLATVNAPALMIGVELGWLL
jgi:hypothetical protein